MRSSFLLCLASILAMNMSANANPFQKKFGGPYPEADRNFRELARGYGGMWAGTFQMLGKNALNDIPAYKKWLESTVNPELAKMKPATPQETRLKDAAVWLRDAFTRVVDSEELSEEKRKEIDTFLADCTLPEKGTDQATKLFNLIALYRAYNNGLSDEQLKSLFDKVAAETQAKPGSTEPR